MARKKVMNQVGDALLEAQAPNREWIELVSMLTKVEGKEIELSAAQVAELMSVLAAVETAFRVREYLITCSGESLRLPNKPLKIIMDQVDKKVAKYMKQRGMTPKEKK